MNVVIHAVPERLWYVEEFLLPALDDQGADSVRIWTDSDHKGNLASCMECFAAMEGGGAWHIQDDVLPCSDFGARCREYDEGVAYGFACRNFGDRLDAWGSVYVNDAWNSFQCVRIPDAWARECAEWFYAEGWHDPDLRHLAALNRFDDYFFREFCQRRHGRDMAYNARPCLTEHVDMLIGGSVINEWRGYWVRAQWFADPDLVDDLREQLKTK